mmetsp:Transcript_12480/g.35538  ORF Transcript_12480/g.35538 Transcript_12480/m.35538 type:complete len:154 (-) Transcript_12480:261-722(-)
MVGLKGEQICNKNGYSTIDNMNGAVLIKTTEVWERLVASKRPMVVMFTSRMCGACKMMKGPFSAMHSIFGKDFLLAVVDLDLSEQAISKNALGAIAFVPVFQIYCQGDRIEYFMANDEDKLKEKIEKVKLDLKRTSAWRLGCLSGFRRLWTRH